MHAVVAERPGTLREALRLRDVASLATPANGEVAVRMVATTINPSDVVTVAGGYGSRTVFPFVPGFEGIGVVSGVGPGVSEDAIGRRVLPIGSAGCWQEQKHLPFSWCVPVPDDIDDRTACFAYINPLTAMLMVERFCQPSVATVVVSGATTAIAGHLAELLNLRGIAPVGLIRGTPGSGVAAPERWRAVIRTCDSDWPSQVEDAAGVRVDVAFDCVGGAIGGRLADGLAPGGVLVHFGLLSGEPLPPGYLSGGHGGRVELFRLRDIVHGQPRVELARLFAPVFSLQRDGLLRSPIGLRLPLTQLTAYLRSEPPRTAGKILIDPQR